MGGEDSTNPAVGRLVGVVGLICSAAALALVPLVLAGGKPGNEIQSPMGQVILGGLVTSTFLNMVLVPILFLRFGGTAPAATLAKPSEQAP